MAVIVKAMVYERYGPPEVLGMREVDTPVLGNRDFLIRVEASSVNRSDWEGLIGKPLYARMGGCADSAGSSSAQTSPDE
jgi:NADPH:quinone reductase-like Zn-dependent oxidoreductase